MSSSKITTPNIDEVSPADGIHGFRQFMLGDDGALPKDKYGIGKKLRDLQNQKTPEGDPNEKPVLNKLLNMPHLRHR